MSGRARDTHGIASGFRARMAWTFFSLVMPAFQVKGRGGTDEAGDSWPELSAAYLAYQRPITGRQRPKAGKLAPGGKDGLLTKAQLASWRHIYARQLLRLSSSHQPTDAKSIAAAIAWSVIKKQGAKTKLADPRFGGRQVGSYQILVDEGTLRRSIQPGELVGTGEVTYQKPDNGQIVEGRPGQVVVGSSVPYAKAHHEGVGVPQRRLWPEQFPASWWRQIMDQAAAGISQVLRLAGEGRL